MKQGQRYVEQLRAGLSPRVRRSDVGPQMVGFQRARSRPPSISQKQIVSDSRVDKFLPQFYHFHEAAKPSVDK